MYIFVLSFNIISIFRSKDKKSSIRIKVINYIHDILENHRELANDINSKC